MPLTSELQQRVLQRLSRRGVREELVPPIDAFKGKRRDSPSKINHRPFPGKPAPRWRISAC